MRYKVGENRQGWYILDTAAEVGEQVIFWASKELFPDAKKMARDQCLFLNESPAMKAA